MQRAPAILRRAARPRAAWPRAAWPQKAFSTRGAARQYEALEVLVEAAGSANSDERKGASDGGNEQRIRLRSRRKSARRGGSSSDGGGRGGGSDGSPAPGDGSAGGKSGSTGGKSSGAGFDWRSRARNTFVRAAETAMIMTSGLAMLGFAGLLYHRAYRQHTMNKMEHALDTWDPVLAMSSGQKKLGDDAGWVERPQQALVDAVVSGRTGGRYWLLLGEKGTGKTSMLLHAIQHVEGRNVVVMDAHADPEIFRQRLGKALNFEFHEDYWGGLFSLRGPRENTYLDIERVFNVLEEVAVRRFKRLGRPLCVVVNHAHLIPENEDGTKLLTLLQQKAESFSGSGIANFVFNCDDYWLYQRLQRAQTRMDAISVSDLTKPEAVQVLRRMRQRVVDGAGARLSAQSQASGGSTVGEVAASGGSSAAARGDTGRARTGTAPSAEPSAELSAELCETIYGLVGGRPQHLAAVVNHADMVAACQRLIDKEKQWFLNCCGLLGAEMDDDVMDSGKFASSGMLLARAFVQLEDALAAAGELLDPADGTRSLPRIPLWRARQIMTRPDFIREYDNLNLFTLDAFSRVKPDSVVMMHAFREIVELPGFAELLDATLDRVAAIESLGRTRELTLKDLGGGGSGVRGALVLRPGNRLELDIPGDEGEETDYMLDSTERHFWKQRLYDIREIDKALEKSSGEQDSSAPRTAPRA